MGKTDNIYILIILSMAGTFGIIVSFVLIHFRNLNRLAVQAEQLQRARLQYQQELLTAIIQSQELERKRIGQDLHDDVGTALSNLRMTVELYQHGPAATDLSGLVHTCKTIIDKVIAEVRHISHNLSPVSLDLYGFTDAIEDLADMINNGGRLRCAIDNEAPELLDSLPSLQATALYRVVEELLNNTMKHAAASQIQLRFFLAADALHFHYRDNGQGIAAGPGKKGMGMHNIESRLSITQATYTMETAPGQGFALAAQIPLQAISTYGSE